MKKKETPRLKDFSQLNYVPIYSAFQRAYQLAQLGGFSMGIFYPKGLEREEEHKRSINQLLAAYGFYSIASQGADIFIEINTLTWEELQAAFSKGYETMEDTRTLYKKALEYKLPPFELDQASEALLSSAWGRMQFTTYDFKVISKLAQNIARLNFNESIKVEHIAEAVMLRCKPDLELYQPFINS
jgi:hypothetical protein